MTIRIMLRCATVSGEPFNWNQVKYETLNDFNGLILRSS